MKRSTYLALICLSIALVRCGAVDDLHDTKNVAQELKGTMTEMNDSTDVVVDYTRDDLGYERTLARYDDLFKDRGDTNRLLAGVAYCSSYPFQQMTKRISDNQATFQEQVEESLKLFMPRLDRFVNHNYRDMGFFPTNTWKAFASLSTTIDTVHKHQMKFSARTGIPTESFYSLIVKGLGYKKLSLRNKKAVPQFAWYVLDFEKEAVTLLNLRHNYYLAMVLSRFTDFATSNTEELITFLKANSLYVDVDADQIDNSIKLEDHAVDWLKKALQTQKDLVKLGYPLEFNVPLQTVFGRTQFKLPESMKANLVDAADLIATMSEADQLANEIKKPFQEKMRKEFEDNLRNYPLSFVPLIP